MESITPRATPTQADMSEKLDDGLLRLLKEGRPVLDKQGRPMLDDQSKPLMIEATAADYNNVIKRLQSLGIDKGPRENDPLYDAARELGLTADTSETDEAALSPMREGDDAATKEDG